MEDFCEIVSQVPKQLTEVITVSSSDAEKSSQVFFDYLDNNFGTFAGDYGDKSRAGCTVAGGQED
jgi:DNA primase